MRKYFLLSFVCTLILGSVLAVPALAEDYGLSATAGAAGLTGPGDNLPVVVGNVIGTALSMVAVLFFGLMIYGGIIWMTARGDEGQTKKAFDTITAAVIGIAIILASYAITSFAFKTVGGPSPSTPVPTNPTPVSTPTDTTTPKTCADRFSEGYNCLASTACETGSTLSLPGCFNNTVCCKPVVGAENTVCGSNSDCSGTTSCQAPNVTVIGRTCLVNTEIKTAGDASQQEYCCVKADGTQSKTGINGCVDGYFLNQDSNIPCPLNSP